MNVSRTYTGSRGFIEIFHIKIFIGGANYEERESRRSGGKIKNAKSCFMNKKAKRGFFFVHLCGSTSVTSQCWFSPNEISSHLITKRANREWRHSPVLIIDFILLTSIDNNSRKKANESKKKSSFWKSRARCAGLRVKSEGQLAVY